MTQAERASWRSASLAFRHLNILSGMENTSGDQRLSESAGRHSVEAALRSGETSGLGDGLGISNSVQELRSYEQEEMPSSAFPALNTGDSSREKIHQSAIGCARWVTCRWTKKS